MVNTQTQTTIHDHFVGLTSQTQTLVGAMMAQYMSQGLTELAESEIMAHSDYRRALLQRAASITQGTRTLLTNSNLHASAEEERLFKTAEQNVEDEIAAASRVTHQIPTPKHFQPDPAPGKYTGYPTPDDPYPDQYWSWLQAHITAFPLQLCIDKLVDKFTFTRPRPNQEFQADLVAVVSDAVSTIGYAISQRGELPVGTPPNGVEKEDLQNIRTAAQYVVKTANETVQQLIDEHFSHVDFDVTKAALAHPTIANAINETPFSPDEVRTIVVPDNDPNGPAVAVAFHYSGTIRGQMLLEDAPEDYPAHLFTILKSMTMRHLALDYLEKDTKPPESVRIKATVALTPARASVNALSPDNTQAIIKMATDRNIPESAIKNAFSAACGHLSIATDAVLSDAGVTPHRCNPETFEAIADAVMEATNDPFLVQHLANTMNLPAHLLELPRAIVNPSQIEAITTAAQEEGIPEYYIDLYVSRTDDGTADVFNPPPQYRDNYPRPIGIYNPPKPTAEPSTCQCQACGSGMDLVVSPRDTLTLEIRHQGDAVVIQKLTDIHQKMTTEAINAEITDAILEAIEEITLKVDHHLVLNQINTTHPYPEIAKATKAAAAQANLYLAQQQTRDPTTSNSQLSTAIRTNCHILHAAEATKVHEKVLLDHCSDIEQAMRHLHAMHLMLTRADLRTEDFLRTDLKVQQKALISLNFDPKVATQEIRETVSEHQDIIMMDIPEAVSEAAAQHEELLNEALSNQYSPLDASYTWTKGKDGQAVLPAIVRRYHQGTVYYRLTYEPTPKDYPSTWAKEDHTALVSQTIRKTETTPSKELMKHATSTVTNAMLGMHNVQEQSWERIAQLIRGLGLTTTAVNQTIRDLSGNLLNSMGEAQRPYLPQPPVNAEAARQIIDAARNAGADAHQVYQIAATISHQHLADKPPPVAIRHARAMARAARQRGVPQRYTTLIQKTLLEPQIAAEQFQPA